MIPDVVNGIFEATGAFFVWGNAWKLHQDREIKGVYWPSWIFFSSWGIWNLYYYPSLSQWWSFVGGALLVTGNLAWVTQAALLSRKRRVEG